MSAKSLQSGKYAARYPEKGTNGYGFDCKLVVSSAPQGKYTLKTKVAFEVAWMAMLTL